MSSINQPICNTEVDCAVENDINSAFADSPFSYDDDKQSISLHVEELSGQAEELEFLRVGFYNLCVSYNNLVTERKSWNTTDSTNYIILPVWQPIDETTNVTMLLDELKKDHETLRRKHKAILIERKRIRQQNKFYIDKLKDKYTFT